MLAPPLWSTVSSVMSLGFTARETIPIVFFGFLICSVVITLTGKMGATYNVPFPVIVRSIFGMYGSYPAICLRAFVAAMWTAILCVQAGDFLGNCITAIWPSFANFPNHLPANAGITSAGLLTFFLYWIFQTILACMRIENLRILFLLKAIIVPPTFLALFLWAAIVTHGGGPLVTGHFHITSTYMNTAYSSLTALNVIMGLFSSMAVNMPDFGRFSKNRLAGYNQYFALPIIGTLGALTPIFVTSAHSQIWGGFQWYMPAVIAQFDSRAAKFFTGFSFIIATIGNQIAAGTYPFSNDVTGLDPKHINIFRATLIISIFCVVCTPWNIIKNAAGLLAFLSGYSCMVRDPLLTETIVAPFSFDTTLANSLPDGPVGRSHGV
jgi:NCS1 family nucleobase:cation symporter-1